MILCVDTKALKTAPDVQKDVDLEDILNNHTEYFNSMKEALEDGYVPLDFSVTIRSLYDNSVVEIDKGEEKRYYTNLTDVQPFMHKGYDLIMYLTSIGLMHNVDYKLGFDELMVKHSQFVPMGLYNPEPTVINPIIYSHVLMSDEGMKDLTKYLKGDRKVVPISDIKEKGNIPALLKELIIVKEEETNEQCDNN